MKASLKAPKYNLPPALMQKHLDKLRHVLTMSMILSIEKEEGGDDDTLVSDLACSGADLIDWDGRGGGGWQPRRQRRPLWARRQHRNVSSVRSGQKQDGGMAERRGTVPYRNRAGQRGGGGITENPPHPELRPRDRKINRGMWAPWGEWQWETISTTQTLLCERNRLPG